MKLRGLILCLTFFVYFFNSSLAIFQLNHQNDKKSCCMKMMAHHKMPSKCPNKQKDCQRDCYNCPFAYITTFTPLFSIASSFNFIDNKYSGFKNSDLKEFYREHWKPPNTRSAFI